MRRALVKRVVTLLLLLTMVVPYCFVTYNDVYGDSKQNLSDANIRKVTFRVNMIRHRRSLMSLSHRVMMWKHILHSWIHRCQQLIGR